MKDEKKTQVSQEDVRAPDVMKEKTLDHPLRIEAQKQLHDAQKKLDDLTDKQLELSVIAQEIERKKAEGEAEAMRFNDGKVEWSLVDFKSIEPMVRVLEYGSEKYSKDNWKKGMDVTKMMESLLRHSFSFLSGETEDQESGISHIGHVMCNAMFIQWMLENKPERDDRV